MKREVFQYIETVLKTIIARLPNSSPYHRLLIEPDYNRLSLEIFIGDTIQSIGFEIDEPVFENPIDLVDAIFDDLRKAGYEV